jgi:nicotinamidase-related amidase
MDRVKPNVARLVEAAPRRTIFTRFIPPHTAEEAVGVWRDYYARWRSVTTSVLDPRLLDLVDPLRRHAEQATVIDKRTYSAFGEPRLLAHLREHGITGVVVTGSETDVCVLSSVLDAVDIGLRVTVVEDAVCSSSDDGHDALMMLYRERYSLQIQTACTDEVLADWT